MKVLVGITSDNWCAANTSRGMAPYSKYDVTVSRLVGHYIDLIDFNDYDVVYLHSSRLMKNAERWIEATRKDVKWGAGVRGWPAYKKYKRKKLLFSGLSVPNRRLKDMMEHDPRFPHSNVHVCHQGVDPDQFHPMPEYEAEEFTVMWAGNPQRASKRYHMFIELPHRKIAAGPETDRLSYGKVECARLYPHDMLPVFYNMGHVYVQPARNDAFSACPLEAAACAKPIVGFTGLPDRGGNGIEEYIPEEWRPQTEVERGEGELPKITRLIDALREDDTQRFNYGWQLRTIVSERYNHHKIAQEYDELFKAIHES